jgi:hypothetical protein
MTYKVKNESCIVLFESGSMKLTSVGLIIVGLIKEQLSIFVLFFYNVYLHFLARVNHKVALDNFLVFDECHSAQRRCLLQLDPFVDAVNAFKAFQHFLAALLDEMRLLGRFFFKPFLA